MICILQMFDIYVIYPGHKPQETFRITYSDLTTASTDSKTLAVGKKHNQKVE